MLRAAATDVGRLYKRQLVDLLDVREGHTVLDAGCGPGTDLPTLAERVGATGTVVGVDRDPAMLAQARERTRELRRVEIREGTCSICPSIAARWIAPRSTGCSCTSTIPRRLWLNCTG